MRIETLSDHPGDMVADAVRDRERGPAEQAARVDAARSSRSQARAEGRWLTWLRLAFAVPREKRELARQRLLSRSPTDEEEALRAGSKAETRVADGLGRVLGDDWVLFRGYRNRRGEIDGLLVGPGGLFAYEVKYRNATVYIRGDDWEFEKFDKYGNSRSGIAPLHDRHGRSPSEQLNEPIAALTDWLGKRGQQTMVAPVVLLTHDRARVGSIQQPTVLVETSVQALLRLVGRSPATLNAKRQTVIEQIIRDDHRHHERRIPGSRRTP
jgi:hypothetical protein